MHSAIIKYICGGTNNWIDHIERQYDSINKSLNSENTAKYIYHICETLFILSSKIDILNTLIRSPESIEYKKKIKKFKNFVFKKYKIANTMRNLQCKNVSCTSLSHNNENISPDDQKIKQLENIVSSLHNILRTDINKFSFVYRLHKDVINKIIIPKSYSLMENGNMINLNISIDNYNYINSMIYGQTYRKELQDKFYRINKNIMRNFAKSLILQHHVSKKYGYSSYGQYKLANSNTDLKYVELTLKNIIDNLVPLMKNYLDIIKRDMNVEYVLESDINYWFSNKKKIILLSPNNIINYVAYIVNLLFGLKFSEISNNMCEIYDSRTGEELGTIYIDILCCDNKNKFPVIHSVGGCSGEKSKFVLTAGYTSISENILSLEDSVYLFKQFGILIYQILQKRMYIDNIDIEHYNFMGYFMEHIFWDRKYLSNLIKDGFLLSFITEIHKMELIKNMFFNSIDSLFDLLIHNSNHFVDVCRDLAKDEKNLHTHINKLYFNLFDSLMSPLKNIFTYDKSYFNPNILLKIIGGDACIIYSSVFNTFVSYNILQTINSGNTKAKMDFVEILSSINLSFGKLLDLYSKQQNVDQYNFDTFLMGNKLNDKFIKSFDKH